MNCENCGQESPAASDYCVNCGAEMRAGQPGEPAMMAAGPQSPEGPYGDPVFGGSDVPPQYSGQAMTPPPVQQAPPPAMRQQPAKAQPPPQQAPQPMRAQAPLMAQTQQAPPAPMVTEAPVEHYGSPIVGLLTMIAGAAVFIMTWVPWIRNLTGYNLMVLTGSGNFLYRIVPGQNILVFTGFWAMLTGVLLFFGGLIMVWRHALGGTIALIGGLIGTLTGVVTLIFIYRLGTAFPGTTGFSSIIPMAGIWVFTIIAFIAFIEGILGVEGVDNPANDRLSARTAVTHRMMGGGPAMGG